MDAGFWRGLAEPLQAKDGSCIAHVTTKEITAAVETYVEYGTVCSARKAENLLYLQLCTQEAILYSRVEELNTVVLIDRPPACSHREIASPMRPLAYSRATKPHKYSTCRVRYSHDQGQGGIASSC